MLFVVFKIICEKFDHLKQSNKNCCTGYILKLEFWLKYNFVIAQKVGLRAAIQAAYSLDIASTHLLTCGLASTFAFTAALISAGVGDTGFTKHVKKNVKHLKSAHDGLAPPARNFPPCAARRASATGKNLSQKSAYQAGAASGFKGWPQNMGA